MRKEEKSNLFRNNQPNVKIESCGGKMAIHILHMWASEPQICERRKNLIYSVTIGNNQPNANIGSSGGEMGIHRTSLDVGATDLPKEENYNLFPLVYYTRHSDGEMAIHTLRMWASFR